MLMHFAANIMVCHTCRWRARNCTGPCPCVVDGRDIIEHAKTADCPKDKFAFAARSTNDHHKNLRECKRCVNLVSVTHEEQYVRCSAVVHCCGGTHTEISLKFGS